MDTLIANVAKKKGIRGGIVLAGYDLTRKEPTAVAYVEPVPTEIDALTQRVNELETLMNNQQVIITTLQQLLVLHDNGLDITVTVHGNDQATFTKGVLTSVS